MAQVGKVRAFRNIEKAEFEIEMKKFITINSVQQRMDTEFTMWNIGKMGTYMIAMFISTSLVGAAACYSLITMIVGTQIKYSCYVKEMDHTRGWTLDQIRDLTIPEDFGQSCVFYDYPYKQLVGLDYIEAKLLIRALPIPKLNVCMEYLKETLEIESQFFLELELSCDTSDVRGMYRILSYIFGAFIGSLLGGLCVDKFGRWFMFRGMMYLNVASGIGLVRAQTYWFFCGMRCVNVMSVFTLWISGFCMLYEYANYKTNNRLALLFPAMHCVAIGVLMIELWLKFESWRLREAGPLVLNIIPLFGLFWFPESARWQFTANLMSHAELTLKKISRVRYPEELDNYHNCLIQISLQKCFQIFDNSIYSRYMWLIFIVLISTNEYIFDLVFINHKLDMMNYLALVLLSKFVAHVVLVPVFLVFGRQLVVIIFFLVTAILFAVVASINAPIIVIYGYFVGKILVCSAHAVIIVLTAELYPTISRGTSLGVAIFVSNVSYVWIYAYLGNLHDQMFERKFHIAASVAAGLAMVASFFLPRIQNRVIVNTAEEANEFSFTLKNAPLEVVVQQDFITS